MCIFLTVDIILCTLTVYQLYVKTSYISISKYSKRLTVITMILFTLCAIGDITGSIHRYMYELSSQEWDSSSAYLGSTKTSIYYIGNFTFFTLLLMRIKTSFQVSKCTMIYLYTLLVILIITATIYCLLLIYFLGRLTTTTDIFGYLWIIALFCTIFSDFILNLSLFILFVYKIKNKDSMEGMEIADDLSGINNEHNSEQKAIWNVMIKHCILFGIALFSNQMWSLTVIVVDLTSVDLKYGFASALIRIYMTRSVQLMINTVILWLVLKINNDRYVKICKCAHSCILKYCMKEDPNMIREGFVVEQHEQNLLQSNEISMMATGMKRDNDNGNGRIEGHDLMVTHVEERKDGVINKERVDSKVEGHDVLITYT